MIPNLHQSLMEPAAEPAFATELDAVWGRAWGASDEVGVLRRALVRQPSPGLAQIHADAWNAAAGALVDPGGRWYWTSREPPDLDLMAQQHAGLVAALEADGVEVVVAEPASAAHTKDVYTRDPLITVPGGAVIGRMGVRMRRGEEAAVTRTVAAEGMPILGTIVGTGTLEGGSVVKLDRSTAAIGLGIRCNEHGARQLSTILEHVGMSLLRVALPGYSIHLDLHLAMVDVGRALVDATGLPYWFLEGLQADGIETIAADPSEAWSLNLLCLRPGRVLMAEGSSRTAAILEGHGIEVVTIPYDEIHKNGGGVHCSTMELVREPASTPASASLTSK